MSTRYLLAFFACIAALCAQVCLRPFIGPDSLLLFVFAVVAVAFYCGYKSGIFAVFLAAVVADLDFVPPLHSLAVTNTHWEFRLVLFIFLGLIINGLVEHRRKAEVREAAVSERFHDILDQTPVGIIIISRDGYITFANQCAAEIYNTKPAMMIGRLPDEPTWGVAPDDSPRHPATGLPFQEALRNGGAPVRMARLIPRRDSEWKELCASAVTLNNGSGPTGEVLVSITDATSSLNCVESPSLNDESVAVSTPYPKLVPVLYLDHTSKLSGGEIALSRLLGALNKDLYRPIVVLGEPGPLVDQLRQMEIETHVMPLNRAVGGVRKDTLGLSALRRITAAGPIFAYAIRIAHFARKNRVRIIHTNSLKSDIYGAIAGRLAGIPVVWHVRDHIDPSYLPGPAVKCFRWLTQFLPSYLVTNSSSTLETLLLSKNRPSAIVPSGLDLHASVIHDSFGSAQSINPESIIEREWGNPVRIGMVGRLASWKGQHVFLEAASAVLAEGYSVKCFIIGSAMFGEAAYEEKLRSIASSDLLRPHVEFLGFRSDMADVLMNLDILVHASTSPEPFGQVVIEGMAEGLPVIATNGGGVREIVTDGNNGLLVPMGDAVALAAALRSLLDDPLKARRLGMAAYRHVRQHFTSSQSARRVEKVYSDIIGSRR